jgi:hypothetical protein
MEGFTKQAVEMTSGDMVYIPMFITVSLGYEVGIHIKAQESKAGCTHEPTFIFSSPPHT